MVQFDEARQLMDEMMKVTIFQPSEKRRMLEDERKTFLDPNLVMDARHKIFRENLYGSPAKSSALAEAKKLLTQEETRELQLKRQRVLIERELRKFEQDLKQSRPKFCGPYICSRKNLVSSDDEVFWKTSSKIKQALVNKRERGKTAEPRMAALERKTKRALAEISTANSQERPRRRATSEIEEASFGNIKITIKDKLSCESEKEEARSCVLRSCFDALRQNARDKQRLRGIKINVQSIASRGNLRQCVRAWRTHTQNAKKKKRDTETKDFDARKIDTLIETISETQKELTKRHRAEPTKRSSASGARNDEARKRIPSCRPVVVESPAQSRLNAQKEIIRKQRMKLSEQSRLIEELRLKQVQEEITRSGEQTMNAAKETLTYCGQQTRRTLIQLMRQAGYRDKSLTAPLRVPSPPRFLMRMEARSEARRNRIKLREEARQRKLEDERRREEAVRREEERERKRSQQEALREARRIREERERQRAREIERYKQLNAMAEAFYRKHLLRRYIMEPLAALVETKNNYVKRADDHYERCLLRKVFVRWKMETERQVEIKIQLATSLYNRNLLWWALQRWKEAVMDNRRKEQVAKDFSDMKLQSRYFKMWKIKAVEYKTERLKHERLASEYYERKLKTKYFGMWRRYPEIVPDIAESERLKEALREIVQEVVPDFDPRQRGVLLED